MGRQSAGFDLPFEELRRSAHGVWQAWLQDAPDFDVIERLARVEIRRYPPALLAEITTPGTPETALEMAFDRGCAYLFGSVGRVRRAAMCSDFYVANATSLASPPRGPDPRGELTFRFFLGSARALEQAPLPGDASVRLMLWPAHLSAVVPCVEGRSEATQRRTLVRAVDRAPHLRARGRVSLLGPAEPVVTPFRVPNELHLPIAKA